MQSVFRDDVFSIVEMFFEKQIVFFRSVTQSCDHDRLHDYFHRVKKNNEFVRFKNEVIRFVKLAKKRCDWLTT